MIIHDITRLIVLLAVEKGESVKKHCVKISFIKEENGVSGSVLEDMRIAVEKSGRPRGGDSFLDVRFFRIVSDEKDVSANEKTKRMNVPPGQ